LKKYRGITEILGWGVPFGRPRFLTSALFEIRGRGPTRAGLVDLRKNLLIRRWFLTISLILSIALQHGSGQILTKKILLANSWLRITLSIRAEFVQFCKECQMAWKTPKIVEVPVGMEINMYACAARK
jgi:coenzyme PQQ precursor peptide PqqA